MKLNLGCGDKLLDGYVNVDITAREGARSPDVISDLRFLDVFEDCSADEVLAVHVIEHFWHWEVSGVLNEWKRVLRPGGILVLECPNLITASHEFLKNPDLAALGGVEGQKSMWVFYGDPKWKDPLMSHRWGYTPLSLAKLLYDCGFKSVERRPAQFKLGEPRDMRLEAFK